MARGLIRLVAVASLCATVAMLGGFASTKSVHKGRGFDATLGGSPMRCESFSANAVGSELMYNCKGFVAGKNGSVCMKDSWAAGTWTRSYRAGACGTNNSAPWIVAKSWSGIL